MLKFQKSFNSLSLIYIYHIVGLISTLICTRLLGWYKILYQPLYQPAHDMKCGHFIGKGEVNSSPTIHDRNMRFSLINHNFCFFPIQMIIFFYNLINTMHEYDMCFNLLIEWWFSKEKSAHCLYILCLLYSMKLG